MQKVKYSTFLKDVLLCSIGAYGGPEAHYGIFSKILVEKKKYIKDEQLTEMMGLYALVPGPSSTQTITGIGYYVGGPLLALFTFLVWAFPAILMMSLIGVFFTSINGNQSFLPMLEYLPVVAIAFIIYAAIRLSIKTVKKPFDLYLFIVMLGLSLWLVPYSMWVVPMLLISGGIIKLLPHQNEKDKTFVLKPRWWILCILIGVALLNETLRYYATAPLIALYTAFFRYGYSVIGGGQIVIPLMIQDLVESQALLSLSDFLSGYAIDQAIPGPLFSFAAFVSARSYGTGLLSFFSGLLGGLSIFAPGILLVFFISPLYASFNKLAFMKHFLKGVSITAAALITMTAITQTVQLPVDLLMYTILILSTGLLFIKKIPAPLIVVLGALLGFII